MSEKSYAVEDVHLLLAAFRSNNVTIDWKEVVHEMGIMGSPSVPASWVA